MYVRVFMFMFVFREEKMVVIHFRTIDSHNMRFFCNNNFPISRTDHEVSTYFMQPT